MAPHEESAITHVRPSDTRPRVFVSYAHDTEHHKTHVLQLCHLLRRHGIDAHLDSYDSNERQDWYAWYLDQVTQADFVLVVASPSYRAAGDGHAPASSNRGVQSEAAHLRDLLHADRPTWTRKLLPVVLPGGSLEEIPLFLQPYCASRYVITELTAPGVEDLLRTITAQPAYPPPALGDIPILPPRELPDEATPRTTETQVGTSTMHAHAVGPARVYQAAHDQYITER
jgi:hypothetical protein